MKFRIAITSKPWASGRLSVGVAESNSRGQKYIVLRIAVRGQHIARVQLKGGQAYQLANMIVDAMESIHTPLQESRNTND